MWLVTDRGFYSVVDKGDREGYLCVRGRLREDLEALFELEALGKYADGIIETHDSDYRYRVYVTREDWTAAVADLASRIDYDNFKNVVARRQGHDRARAYGKVWSALYDLQL
jgi:hypothetical protein